MLANVAVNAAVVGARVSQSLLERTGSKTAKPLLGMSREGKQFVVFAVALILLVALTERLAYAGYVAVMYLQWSLRFIATLLSYWLLNSLQLYYQDFYNRRKHRWERGCSSYALPPCPGARMMKDWSTSAPQEPGQRAPLNFDHVHLYLSDFLWIRFFVALPQNLAVFWSLVTLRQYRAQFTRVYLRRWLERQGFIDPLDLPSPGDTFAKFCLNSSMSTYYQGPLRHEEDGSVVGRWVVEHAGIPTEDSKNEYGRFEAEIDVANEKFLWARYTPLFGPDGSPVSEPPIDMKPEDALVMAMYELFTHIHPQMHAWANFGVSTCSSSEFVARMSKITVGYNHLGNNGAPEFFGWMHKIGVTDFVNYETFRGAKRHPAHGEQRHGFLSRVQEHLDTHHNIYDLMEYSDFVKFIVQVRSKFFREFRKYQDTDFLGVHPEGLFLGTVLHSLDHEQVFLADVNEFCCADDRFKPCEEFLICAHQLADGFHNFPFAYQFKDAPHPFYQDVYDFAHKLNPDWAKLMDACIIR